jgi:hypothetical protein
LAGLVGGLSVAASAQEGDGPDEYERDAQEEEGARGYHGSNARI